MSAQRPQVLEGLRGPREERAANASTPQATGHDKIPAGKRVFQSHAARFRLQLDSAEDVKVNGRLIPGKAMTAQFVDQFLVLDGKKDKAMIELLDTSDYNKKNGGADFWDFQTVLDGIVEARRNQAVEILSNPDDRQAILEQLRAEGIDFQLPKSATGGAGKKTE